MSWNRSPCLNQFGWFCMDRSERRVTSLAASGVFTLPLMRRCEEDVSLERACEFWQFISVTCLCLAAMCTIWSLAIAHENEVFEVPDDLRSKILVGAGLCLVSCREKERELQSTIVSQCYQQQA